MSIEYLIVRTIKAQAKNGRDTYVVKAEINKKQHQVRVQRRVREILGEDKYTVDVHEAVERALQEIDDDYEDEKLKFL